MAYYYVNQNEQSNGDHEVHEGGCYWLPGEGNRIYVGWFASCTDAVKAAKQHYRQSNGCYHCSRACHTS
jgi:hypothetical protein